MANFTGVFPLENIRRLWQITLPAIVCGYNFIVWLLLPCHSVYCHGVTFYFCDFTVILLLVKI
jgi:hypothetical protein